MHYDEGPMNSRWRLLAVMVLLTATIFTLVHWHQDLDGQRCEVCRVQQTPSLYTPVQNPLSAPVVHGRDFIVREVSFEIEAFSPGTPGRAPPSFSFPKFLT